MSGHSKWSQIKHKKAITDAKKSQLFSKLARLITVASREAGPDPLVNIKLREAIERARSLNMPSNNIERAIKRGVGAIEKELEEFIYEAYGPGGIAILITGITDNTNRTSSEIKHLLNKHESKLAKPGSVSWVFEKKDNKWTPKEHSTIELNEKNQTSLVKLLEALDDHEDVQNIFTNEKI